MARRCPVFPAADLPLNVPVAIGVALILAGLYKAERSRTTVEGEILRMRIHRTRRVSSIPFSALSATAKPLELELFFSRCLFSCCHR